MPKRFIFPQQYNDRKKPKLDVSISDHNFPLSQNPGSSKETNQTDTWGDDNDDEILLLASQACEDAYSGHDVSNLPDYSMCMQPSSTSTQMAPSTPSTSKSNFTFKKPSPGSSNLVTTTNLKDKYQRISSPLPGITPKMEPMNERVNLTDDLIFNDKICQGQNSEQVYKQMMQLKEENAKLRSENGKLLEKCVTKEGESSILRTQLKSCQVAVDNARLEKLRAQEKVQMDWTEKLTAANKQMQDLRTQLDFKNLEIISIKEKCKVLESSKVRLTQVTVPANDISFSYRNNNSVHLSQSAMQARRGKMSTCGVQTVDRAHFIKLNKAWRRATSKLKDILPLVLEPSPQTQNSILEHSDKLQKPPDFSQNKCRIFSTFHRIASSPVAKVKCKIKLSMESIYGDLTSLSGALDKGLEVGIEEKIFDILNTVSLALNGVITELDAISQRMTTAFQKEMDEKYIETTATFFVITKQDLLSGKLLYKDEQAVPPRRMSAVLSHIVASVNQQMVKRLLDCPLKSTDSGDEQANVLAIVCRLCCLLDSTSCTILYSGLLLALINLLENLLEKADKSTKLHTKLLEIVRTIITSRPLPVVCTRMLNLLRKLATLGPLVSKLCSGNTVGNLKTDYDQGVLLYKKESCYLQIFLKEIEAALKCIERQRLIQEAVRTTKDLIALYSIISSELIGRDKSRCDCQLVMSQVMVYALQICAVMLRKCDQTRCDEAADELSPICRTGILVLYQWVLQDIEFNSQLAFNEGHYHLFVELCDEMKDRIVLNEVQANMLSELTGTLQPASEDQDMPASVHQQIWMESFNKFSIVD